MEKIEYYDDDIIRIIDIEDAHVYIFIFHGDRGDVYRMYDTNHDGEQCEDHEHYTDAYNEVAFMFPPYDDPAWPITLEYCEEG